METIWKQVKEDVKKVIDEKSYSLWVKPLEYLHSDEGAIYLGCPNKFSRNWLQENYNSILHTHLSRAGFDNHELVFKVISRKEKVPNNSPKEIQNRQLNFLNIPKKSFNQRCLNSRFSFDNFVVGESNEFAYSVSRSFANNSHVPYSSLFLLSETGLGKSHLIQSIGNSIIKKSPKTMVLYISSEEFTNEMISALKTDSIEQFKDKYRKKCDILLLEGLHFLSGKEKIQNELSYTLDSLFNDEKKVIFTSPLTPKEIRGIKKTLASRLTSGIITNITRPDFNTRLNIIKQKANERKIDLPEDVSNYLAENLTQDVRQIEGAIDSLKANSLLLKRKITIALAGEIVKQLNPDMHIATIEDIQTIVCKYFKISTDEIKSKSRKKIHSYPRSVAIYLCRKYTNKSLKSIGQFLNRNHATILYDNEKIKKEIKTDTRIRKEIEFLSMKIENITP